ncbi:hypothetical protein [Flavobacterium psychrotrophum]|uniref:hypothetical protein n=1 Tax=Flavobacterium psychrotrophum TaxID=2294119 RepID=UPI000E312829|nr:hypothetical protein [Flavobacterium psychrotrophum]
MKKLIIAALLLGGLSSVSASVVRNNENPVTIEKQEKVYSKIATDKVPVAVLKEISEKYEGYNVSAAYASEDSDYKLELAKESTVVTVYYNAKGEFIKEKK